MLDRFYFNYANNYSDMKILVSKSIVFPSSNEEVEEIPVDGMSSSLTIRKGTYKDKVIPISYKLMGNFEEGLDRLEEWFTDIKDNRLIFKNRPHRAYRVKRVEKDDMDLIARFYGESKVNFICEPFLTKDIDEKYIDITKLKNFTYDGSYPGKVALKVQGNGNIQIVINGEVLQIENVNGYVEIDSKLMYCLNKDKTNKDFNGQFPILKKGKNTLEFIGSINRVEMLPRTVYL